MECGRGIDQIWMLQLIAASKRLIAMAMWQSYSNGDAVEKMVAAIDAATWQIRPKPPLTTPTSKKYAQRAIRYDVAAIGVPIANLIRPQIKQLHWQQNQNYRGQQFSEKYAYSEFIGPDGIAHSSDIRIGLLLIAPGTIYPYHHHPADEIYFVLSGEGRFKVPERPARVCPSGQFVTHPSGIDHQIETRENLLLALYFWRGAVTIPAQLSDFDQD